MPETGWAFVLCSSIPVEGREFFLKRQWRAGSNFVRTSHFISGRSFLRKEWRARQDSNL